MDSCHFFFVASDHPISEELSTLLVALEFSPAVVLLILSCGFSLCADFQALLVSSWLGICGGIPMCSLVEVWGKL